jgi:hypothetical protein
MPKGIAQVVALAEACILPGDELIRIHLVKERKKAYPPRSIRRAGGRPIGNTATSSGIGLRRRRMINCGGPGPNLGAASAAPQSAERVAPSRLSLSSSFYRARGEPFGEEALPERVHDHDGNADQQ